MASGAQVTSTSRLTEITSAGVEVARKNSNVLSVLTSHGGHLGWVTGWRRQWMCPAVADFLLATESVLSENAARKGGAAVGDAAAREGA